MARIDHIAFRTSNREKSVEFFQKAFGYKIQKTFDVVFNADDKAICTALEPPEKINNELPFFMPFMFGDLKVDYHLAPELFISEGGKIVSDWVKKNGSGIHHIAICVPSVKEIMKEWKEKGLAEFSSDEPFNCDGLTQVFTREIPLLGVVLEFIEREKYGFCEKNVANLMKSSTM